MRARSFFQKNINEADKPTKTSEATRTLPALFILCKLPYKTLLIFVNRNTKRHGHYQLPQE